MASDEAHDEVAGRPAEAVQGADAVVAGWLRRAWSQRSRAEWPVAWYLPLLTAAVALVLVLASRLPAWPAHYVGGGSVPPYFARPSLLDTLLNASWLGAFVGLGLVVVDRLVGRWRRPLRWALAGALFAGLLTASLPEPTDWRYLADWFRADGLRGVLAFRSLGQTGVWALVTLVRAILAAAWLWWVARAVAGTGLPHGRLARSGAEAAVVIALALLLLSLPESLTSHEGLGPRWRELWTGHALGLVAAALRGALNGLVIAVALWAGRPSALRERPAGAESP